MKKTILGVKIDDINMDQALETVKSWLSKGGPASPRGEKHYIVTPNPEIIVAAQEDSKFKKVLNNADLSLPDGVGLKLSGRVKHIVNGTDFMEKLVERCSVWGFTTGFLGGRDKVAEKSAECLKKKYPKLKVSFTGEEPGKIPATDILFVAFGAPKQEYWIAANLDKIPVRVAMGVGGAFDFISGVIPRAPKWIRNLGFEWLFRLVIQPMRIKRQLNLIKYIWLLLKV